MKILAKFVILAVFLQNVASCAFLFNDREVEVVVESMPAGADVIIDGRNYGRTPLILRLEPNDYTATLIKEGYGTTQLRLESWQAVRENRKEGSRCIADAVGTMFILPALSYWSVYCRDFKQPKYHAVIPYMGPEGTDPGQVARGGYEGYFDATQGAPQQTREILRVDEGLQYRLINGRNGAIKDQSDVVRTSSQYYENGVLQEARPGAAYREDVDVEYRRW